MTVIEPPEATVMLPDATGPAATGSDVNSGLVVAVLMVTSSALALLATPNTATARPAS